MRGVDSQEPGVEEEAQGSRPAWTSGPWSMKAVYLWYYVASAVYVTYVSLYLRSVHLSGAQIGFIASIIPLAGVALQPLWGLLSDRYRRRKPILVLALLCAAIIAPSVVLAHSFAVLLLLMIALAIALSPVIPLADATTLEWLSRRAGTYGGVRVYGSLGFLVSSLAAGPLLGSGRIGILFPVYGLLLGITFLASLTAPGQQVSLSHAHRGSIRAVLGDRVVIVFLILVAVGFGTSASYNTFFALYMHGLGASTAVIGLAAGIASLSELPVMAVSGRVIARLGVKPLLLLGLGTAAIRWTTYGLLHDYRIVLAFQLLHGLTFAASYVAGVTFMELRVPPRLRSTGQTLFYGATFGVGTVAGANLFGALFDRVHAHGMFLAAGGICGVAVLGIALLVPNTRAVKAQARPGGPVKR